jgi:MFS family permease
MRRLAVESNAMRRASLQIFYGWVVLACVSVILLLTYGVQYSFGVFFTTMLQDLGWSRASLAGAFSVYSLVYIGLSFYSGRLTDRIGPRWVISLGGTCLGTGMILVSQIQAPWQLYLFYGGLAGVGMSVAYVPCNATVVKWFRRRRGLAVGIAGSGASLGIAGFPPLSEALIARFGWRQTYLLFGIAVLMVLNMLACFVVRDPEVLGLQPDGDLEPAADVTPPATVVETSWELRDAIHTGAFWMLAGVMILSLFTIPSVYVHLPQYARDLQIQVPRSVFLMLIGLCALVGNLTLGWLSDLLGRRQAFLLSLIIGMLALGGLTMARGATALYVAAAGFGFYYGTYASLYPAVMGDFFGRSHTGALVGLSFTMGSITSAIGPVAMGWVADRTGQYFAAFLGGAFINSLVVALFAFARPPSPSSRRAMVSVPQGGPGR